MSKPNLEGKSHNPAFSRLESGIIRLDDLLGGGFLAGGTYLILGVPGAGKTILANQICFNRIAAKGRALYVTLLAENHTRMFGNLQPLHFFERDKVADSMQYISGYNSLEKDGLQGLLQLLGESVRRHKADILVIDGVATADELAGAQINFKKFVHNLNSVLGITGCTTFLVSSAEGDETQPEYTMVDGIVNLTFKNEGMRTIREIEVRKFRGSKHLHGRHFYEISDLGILVYPRIESIYADSKDPIVDLNHRKKTGVDGLDGLLKGGLVRASMTSLLGPAGTGKTTTGLKFLKTGAELGERGLFCNFYEHPDRLTAKMDALGYDISRHLENGLIQIFRTPMGEPIVDKMIHLLLAFVREKQIKRLYLDGVAALETGMTEKNRLRRILTALGNELRALDVTAVFTEETDIGQAHYEGSLSNDSGFTDSIIEFRHVELDSIRTVAVSVVKTRESELDPALHEYLHTSKGVELGSRLQFVKPFLPAVERVRSL